MNMQIDLEKGIANVGDVSRMKEVMARAKRGERLVIGFIGGSITQGSLSSTPQTCYAYRVYTWWKETFPQAEFVYCNAGIGGTTSEFGAARVGTDLLAERPDFVIVEFSVNDESTEHFKETYEGLVRKILGAAWNPAVLLVHNVFYHNGANAQVMHAAIGRHYDLPSVSMQSSIYPEVVAGWIENRAITPDDLHPNDEGACAGGVGDYLFFGAGTKRKTDRQQYQFCTGGKAAGSAYKKCLRGFRPHSQCRGTRYGRIAAAHAGWIYAR